MQSHITDFTNTTQTRQKSQKKCSMLGTSDKVSKAYLIAIMEEHEFIRQKTTLNPLYIFKVTLKEVAYWTATGFPVPRS